MYKIAKVCVSGVSAVPIELKPITRGITGAIVEFLYDDDIWAGLRKKVAFRGSEEVEKICDSDTVIFPAEVAQRENVRVTVGVTGINADGTVVIPTKWADLGAVLDSAYGDYPAPGEPVPPIWAQLQDMIGDLDNLGTETKDNLVNAVNEVLRLNQETISGYYTPEVSQPEAGIMQLSFVPSEADMPQLEPVEIQLPKGEPGKDGTDGEDGKSGVYILTEGETIEDAPADSYVVIDPYGESDVDLTDVVKSVNGKTPDENGNIEMTTSKWTFTLEDGTETVVEVYVKA